MRPPPLLAVVARMVGPTVVRRLVPFWVSLLVVGTIFQRSIDVEGLRRSLAGQSLVGQCGWWIALCAGSAVVLRSHARAVFYADRLRPLWRAPISRWRWSTVWMRYSLLLAVPVCAAGLLWPAPAFAKTLGLASAAHPLVLASGGALGQATLWTLAAIAYGAAVFVAVSLSPFPTATAVLCVPGGWALGAVIYGDLRGRVGRRWRVRASLRLDGWFLHLAAYDLKTLLRNDGRYWLAAHAAVLPLVLLLERIGADDGPLGDVGAVFIAVFSVVAARSVERLRGRQGPAFFANRWPIVARQRFAALAAVSSTPAMLLAVGALSIGRGWTFEQIVALIAPLPVLVLAPVAAAIYARQWERALDVYPVVAFGLVLLLLLPPIAGAVTYGGLALAVAVWGARGLQRQRENNDGSARVG